MSRLGKHISQNLVVAILISLALFSCRKSRKAKPMPSEISSYIYAYTSGTISKTAPIRVRFTNSVIEKDKIGGEVGSIISFSPYIDGKAIWEDDRTILVEPKTPLSSKTNYLGSINLEKLYKNLPKGLSTFEFDFQTRELYFDVSTDGLRTSDLQDLNRQSLTGAVNMSDVTENHDVEKLLKAYQEGKELSIKWIHNNEKLRHDFVIDGIIREEKETNLLLKWNGNPLDLSIYGELKIPVSSKNKFEVSNAKIFQEKDQTIVVYFSEPIQQNQDLNGLITLDGLVERILNFTIDGNLLRIYPSSRYSNSHQLFINPGIKSISGKKIEAFSSWNLNFENSNPQVRLVGRGVIMPNSEGLIFPFEAINLNAVDLEIFKIFNNNILQFLQTNNLEGVYDLERVGRVVFQKKISLKEINSSVNNNEWTRYSIDLSKFIKNDPSAIYQIRIGFRQEYSGLTCGTEKKKSVNKNSDLLFTKEETDEYGEVKSIMGDYYGPDGYYNDYRWEDRTNPCKPAYYNSERFIKRNVFSSNLGIIAKGGNDHSYFVAVSDIRTTEQIAGAKLEFFDYQNQLMKTAITDNNGMAMLEFERNPFVVIVTKGEQKGYLKLADANSLLLSRFDIAGVATQKGLKGYLYGERGVWRPGDSLYLNFVLEDKGNKLPTGYPVSFELSDAKGQLFYKTTTTNNVNNIYPFYIATNSESPTGTWMANITVGGAKFNYPLKIETVKPNRLKLSLDFGKNELFAGSGAEIGNLQANWLHGAPANGLNAKVETQLRPVPTKFPKYPSYNFDDPSRNFTVGEPNVIYNGNLDATGNAKVSFQTTSNFLAPGKLKVDFKVRVFEKGGDFSTDNFSLPYFPYNYYVGIDIPEKKGEKRIDIKVNEKINFVLVDKEGNPISNRSLKVGLYRCDWRWWWDQGEDKISQFNSSTHLGAMKQDLIKTNNRGEATWNIKVEEWGRYLVRAVDEIGNHSTGDFFYAGYPWYDDEQGRGSSAATMLSFSSTKEKYKVGDNIELKIPTGDAGKVLITLENGSRVVDYYWKDAHNGENTFRITAKPEFAPTVYAHVSLIQPHSQTKNDLPIRMYGVIPIGVEDPNTILKPAISMPDEIKPDKEFTIEVSEKTGNSMAYTLDIVDDGLLDLTRFQTPNPWNAFYAREALGVKSWDIYDQVLGAYGGELERILSIGGDGINYKGAEQRKANRFKPIVMHLGPFMLESGKKAKHNLKISNYVGSVRAMVVASNKGAYGNAEKTVAVKNPLMILATLPRVLSPGEKLQLPVNVFVMDKKIKNVDITIKESNDLVGIGTSTKSLVFDKMGDDLASFNLDVKNKQGIAKFKIVAKSGNEISMQDIEVDVRNPNPFITNITDGYAEAGKSWSSNYSEIGTPDLASANLEISSLPPLNITSRLEYLIHYPHGCVEQTTSGAFPQLFIDKLVNLDNDKKKSIAFNIKSAIEKLKLFQTDAGGFGYWPGDRYASQWSSNYVGNFLLEARMKGYTIPYNMLERWQRYQQKVAQRWDPSLDDTDYSYDSKELNQAYRLYTLALAKAPELGAMNRLKEKSNLSISAKWRLAAAYAISGKNDIAKQIINNLSYKVAPYTELSYTYGSEVRDMAMILETMTLLGDKQKSFEVLKDISTNIGSNNWYSTQTTAFCLMAASKFVGTTGYGSSLNFSYQIGNGELVNVKDGSGISQIKIPSNGKKVTIKNNSNGIIFTRLITKGKPITNEAPASNKNLNMTVNFKTIKGENLNPSKIVQGTDFVAEVIVTNPGQRGINYQELALTQVFPSGWEIINSRMDNLSSFSNSSVPRYQDIRDDRVYTYFNLDRNRTQVYRIQLNAAYIGKYFMPGALCEAMYDNTIYARKQGQWIEVLAKK